MSPSALCRSGGHEVPCALARAFWLARAAAGLGQLWLSVRRHLRSSMNATDVLRKIDVQQRDRASEPSGVSRTIQGDSARLGPHGSNSDARPHAEANSRIQDDRRKLGASAPPSRLGFEKAGCCQVLLVERFLRRPRRDSPHGVDGISRGWPARRKSRPRNRQGPSF